jgi:hypothetical protein
MLMRLVDTAGVDDLVAALVRMASTFSMKSAEHIKASYQNNSGDPLNRFTIKNTAIFDNNTVNA